MTENRDGKRPVIISIRGLKRTFDGNVVLKGVDLDIYAGETIVILGASGSGKTVFINLLVGLMEPDGGSIVIDGQEVTSFTRDRDWDELRLKMGFLFQGSALYDSMTIGENIAFVLKNHSDLSPEQIEETVTQKLKMVELEGVEDKMPAELSGGMQKRAALARAIAINPRIIMYDEPTTGLDPIRSNHISKLIAMLQRELKVTSIVVTHDLVCASIVANRVVLLQEGKFVFVGTMEELLESRHEYVRSYLEASSFRR